MTNVIELKDVSHNFGNKTVLNGITHSIAAGSLVMLTGANGAGKTTLIKIIATLVAPTSGEIKLFGTSVKDKLPTLRRRLGVYCENMRLIDSFSVAENLDFYARLYGTRISWDDDALATQLQLQTIAHDSVGKLSHGWRKRLALALSLIHQPEVWLLDEPFSGLDEAGVERIGKAMVTATKAGNTVIFTTPLGSQSIAFDTGQSPHTEWQLNQGKLLSRLGDVRS